MRGIFSCRFARRATASIAAALTVLAGCSAGTNNQPSPPTLAEYDISFPSTAAAVSVDTIQTWVFDASTPKTNCASLLVARSSGTPLPNDLAHIDPVALCDLLQNGSKGTIDPVPYGNVVFLVVAQRQGNDYFSGCVLATLSQTSSRVSVQLEQVTFTPIPSTTCTSVSDHCNNKCTVGDGG
jgi:hypothetical protein